MLPTAAPVLLVALFLFHLPFRGSALLLLASAVVFLMTSLGAGLFIPTVSRTQQQAMMSMFLMFQPFFMLSAMRSRMRLD